MSANVLPTISGRRSQFTHRLLLFRPGTNPGIILIRKILLDFRRTVLFRLLGHFFFFLYWQTECVLSEDNIDLLFDRLNRAISTHCVLGLPVMVLAFFSSFAFDASSLSKYQMVPGSRLGTTCLCKLMPILEPFVSVGYHELFWKKKRRL